MEREKAKKEEQEKQKKLQEEKMRRDDEEREKAEQEAARTGIPLKSKFVSDVISYLRPMASPRCPQMQYKSSKSPRPTN